MNKMLNEKEKTLRFHNCIEKDLFIKCIGYNDFHHVEPSHTFRRQNFYTVHLIFNGSGTLILSGREFKVYERSMFFVPPDVDLAYFPDDNNKWDYMWFEFIGSNAEIYTSRMGFSIDNPVIICKNFQSISMTAYNIFKQSESDENINYYDVLSLFYKFVASNTFDDKRKSRTTVDNVISYIACHFHNQNFSIENICHDLYISHAQLCRMFKNSLGKTPVAYLLDMRIDEAGRLLKHTDMHIKEIAYSVGFKDDVHFMKTFKKCRGCTPGEYRKF